MYTWGYVKEATLAKIDMSADQIIKIGWMDKFPFYANEALTQIAAAVKANRTYAQFKVRWNDDGDCKPNMPVHMPNDFISFNGDVAYVVIKDTMQVATDEDFDTFTGDAIVFFDDGDYMIPYNAYYQKIYPTTDDDVILKIPDDVVECLPSYIAGQCFKVDDEQKSSIYRNEFEMLLSRVDQNSYKTSKTIHIGGDW